MRGDHAFTQKTDALEIIDRAGALCFQAVVDFPFRFSDVGNNRRAGAIRKCAHSLEMFFGYRVRRVRRNRRRNQLVSLPALNKLFRVGHRFGVGFVIGDWKIDYGFAEHAT